jgi:hypothetical protein
VVDSPSGIRVERVGWFRTLFLVRLIRNTGPTIIGQREER